MDFLIAIEANLDAMIPISCGPKLSLVNGINDIIDLETLVQV